MADKSNFDENKFDTFLKAYFTASGKSDANTDMFEAGKSCGRLLAGIFDGLVDAGMNENIAMPMACSIFTNIISAAFNSNK